VGPSIFAARLYPLRRPAALLSLTCVRAVTWYALARRDTAVRCLLHPPACHLCPVPGAQCHAPPSSSRPPKLCCEPATPEHPTWYTSRRPQDYTFWLIFSPSHAGQSHARTALLLRSRQSWAPNILTNVPRACPTTIMLVAAHPGSLPRSRHSLFLHCSLSHLKLPTHLSQYRVAGDASSSNVGPALPHS